MLIGARVGLPNPQSVEIIDDVCVPFYSRRFACFSLGTFDGILKVYVYEDEPTCVKMDSLRLSISEQWLIFVLRTPNPKLSNMISNHKSA